MALGDSVVAKPNVEGHFHADIVSLVTAFVTELVGAAVVIKAIV
ncbi:hypothetical protein GCM10009038_28630 [Salinicola rhizosphaerae]|uniref:Uncharacterized protein n=1 Tax=Salinicola rhizosphaerae TaxID=1443141 RepID=A0ABQ3E9Z4_9GAMM|nr:hypothetical protein GCM10009038_28630 [Salinicola rhizosphaerae]